MVNAAADISPDRLSTKALAAAGQFRAIALWLNEPLIPEGIYAQICQDKRPGCIRITVEFERPPLQKPLTQYICHLMWQLNSPLIEGIHLIARPIGASKPLWQQRIRVVTPALKQRLRREQGQGSPEGIIPPSLVQRPATPRVAGMNLYLLADQLKSMRAFMLTGSAVAAFVFGCMIEVVMSSRPGPSLPFQDRVQAEASDYPTQERNLDGKPTEPQLPEFQTGANTVFADRQRDRQPTASAAFETTPVSYKIELERDRPNVVNAALEPVGVLKHERLELPQDPTVTLMFGGDVDLDGLPYHQFEHDGQLLAGLPAFRQADIAMVNLQDPLAQSATSLEEEFLDRQRPDAIDLLKIGGVDLVNLTGENALALGEQGLAETLDTLDRNGVFRVGAGRSEREARRPEIVDVKGQRIAYLSYDRDFNLAADESLSGVNAVAMQDIIEDIQAIRDEVDWLVVNYRWSTEPPATPAESQTNLAQLAIDQGADLVVGQHPDMLQGAELYKGRPIAYSLGDFVYTSATEAPTDETAVLQVAIRAGQMKVDLIPVKVKDGQPQVASGADGDRILQKIRAASQAFREPMPSTVVLDIRPTGADPMTPPEGDGEGFTAEDAAEEAPWTAPADPVESAPETAAPEALDETVPADETNSPTVDEAETVPTEPAPAAEEENLDIEVEAFPDDLLKDWGPKDSPNTIYEPESRLPNRLNAKPSKPETVTPAAPKPNEVDRPDATEFPDATESPAPKLEPQRQPEPKLQPQPAPTDIELQEIDQPPANGAIGPYSEPLVGPMSALPETDPKMKLHQDTLAPQTDVQPGMPATRIYRPLNTLAPSQTPAVTIDVAKIEAIAPADSTDAP